MIIFAAPACPQTASPADDVTLKAILQRLEALEQQNQELTKEVHSLREELAASRSTIAVPAQQAGSTPAEQAASADAEVPLEERVARNETRIEEQAQTKVEASQKFPISLTGMVLFNAFSNSRSSGDSELLTGPGRSGATLRQTLLGFQFQGPHLPANGRIHGDFMMDFFSGSSYPNGSWLRIRRAAINLDWQNRAVMIGQDKPLISPRNPSSLAEVGVPPLAGAGNLWSWLPQVRYEERVHFGEMSGLTPQIALIQTNENYAHVPSEYANSLEKSRPGLEGRVAFWHKWDDVRRFEIAPGFHTSTTHVGGTSIDSRLASLDWYIRPWSRLEFSGTFFRGKNFSSLGALPQSVTVLPSDQIIPVHGQGGWVQLSSPLTSRLTLNLFGGTQSNRARDLASGDIQRNVSYAANLMYRLGPNILVGIEGLQFRTHLVPSEDRLQNHYDLSFAYMF
jgi:hypothetical protein